ncbi:hypothetical protein RJZ56_001719 [Blastomyces dermatitidis]
MNASKKNFAFWSRSPKRWAKATALYSTIKAERWGMAAAEGRSELARILLDNGRIDLRDPSHLGIKSLNIALWQYQEETAIMIADKYRKEGLKIEKGLKALLMAARFGLPDLVESLMKAGTFHS